MVPMCRLSDLRNYRAQIHRYTKNLSWHQPSTDTLKLCLEKSTVDFEEVESQDNLELPGVMIIYILQCLLSDV